MNLVGNSFGICDESTTGMLYFNQLYVNEIKILSHFNVFTCDEARQTLSAFGSDFYNRIHATSPLFITPSLDPSPSPVRTSYMEAP